VLNTEIVTQLFFCEIRTKHRLEKIDKHRFTHLMISWRPREVAASVDENIVVKK